MARLQLTKTLAFALAASIGFHRYAAAQPIENGGFVDQEGAQGVPVHAQANTYADTDPSALTDFRSTLDPYGSWVNDPTYGTVWVPSRDVVGDNFVPYATNGHWDYLNNNYTWVSDFDWGWAPFHYGRWVWVPGHGWSWIAGRQYASAWVDWRTGYGDWDYVGWAPLAPSWFWFGGFAVGFNFFPNEFFVFVPRNVIFSRALHAHVLPRERAEVVARHTRPFVREQPHTAVGPRQFSQAPRMGPPPSAAARQALRGRPATNAQNQQALRFSRPSTAREMGARAPSTHVVQPRAQVSQTPRQARPVPPQERPMRNQPPMRPTPQQRPMAPQERPMPQQRPAPVPSHPMGPPAPSHPMGPPPPSHPMGPPPSHGGGMPSHGGGMPSHGGGMPSHGGGGGMGGGGHGGMGGGGGGGGGHGGGGGGGHR